jgi:hypothetical protein
VEGDRIQIREYIFDVVKAAEIKSKQVLRCQEVIWKIYHGRIVVKNTDHFEAIHWFPIPRTIELLQWSAATDLYGLGAIALYSVYRNGSPKLTDDSGKIEQDFRRMLGYLESKPYFQSIWPELEDIRKQIEKLMALDSELSPAQFAAYRRPEASKTVNKTLQQETIDVVSRITQTVPGTRRLAEVFEFNPGHFVFFIHFVLCCLHRGNHLDEIPNEREPPKEIEVPKEVEAPKNDANEGEKPVCVDEKPFCVDRCEQPGVGGGAELALARLDTIIGFINDPRLRALKTTSSNIPKFDPRPDPAIRIAYSYLLENVEKTVNKERDMISKSFFKRFIRRKKVLTILNKITQILERSKSTSPMKEEDEQG